MVEVNTTDVPTTGRSRRRPVSEGRKKPVTTEVEEGVHAVAMLAAAAEGVKLADILERWLQQGAQRTAKAMKEQVLQEARLRERGADQLKSLAGLSSSETET